MMRNKFDEQLGCLNDSLINMGGLCENAISSAVAALTSGDFELAKRAIEVDREIDQAEKDIERICLRLLLRQQPVARDLRYISAALKMITDMERIGDQAADIAEIVTFTDPEKAMGCAHIAEMAQTATGMVTGSIDAFVKKDLELAQKVIDDDDIVDDLFVDVKHDIVELIAADSSCGEAAVDILMVAKYLERIGDHATNIAEWVVFSITGVHVGGERT